MAKPPVSEQVQVNFRMPADLRDRIKMAADRDGVSMNHVIITTLEEKYPAPRTSDAFLGEIMRHLDGLHEEERRRKLEAMIKFLEWPDDLPENTHDLLRQIYPND